MPVAFLTYSGLGPELEWWSVQLPVEVVTQKLNPLIELANFAMAGPLVNRNIPVRRAQQQPEMPQRKVGPPNLQKAEFRRESLARAPRFDID